MSKKKGYRTYKAAYWLLQHFYPKFQSEGTEKIPAEPSIIVGNHSQIHGPIATEIYFPGKRYIWCAAPMAHRKEVPAYAFEDFWSQKPKYTHWFYKIVSHLIAPLSASIFGNAHIIEVRRDIRLIHTFRETMERLEEGNHIVIFPEHDVKYNHIIYDFQDRFIDVAKMYYRKTGKELSFVPMYVAPKLHTMYFGEPIRFQAGVPIEEERRRICEYLMKEITEIGCSLPEHTVIPYRNIPRKDYPSNIPAEEKKYEKTRR